MACRYLGINIAGGEFGSKVPGILGQDYIYPAKEQVDYFFVRGFNLVRLPILWERVQASLNGPLRMADILAIDNFISYAASHNVSVIIDLHNYGKGWGQLVSTPQCPNLSFANVWHKLAMQYRAMPNVIFGLMNEPNQQNASQWVNSAQSAIAAIRDTGASQRILVPGTYWTGADRWTTTDNAAVMGTITDPLNNFTFEVHKYFDSDGSGSHYDPITDPIACVTPLRATTDWARAQGKTMFLGEYNVPPDPASQIALGNLMKFLNDNSDVWLGSSAWAAGYWWPDGYAFKLEQQGPDKKDAVQLAEITRIPHI